MLILREVVINRKATYCFEHFSFGAEGPDGLSAECKQAFFPVFLTPENEILRQFCLSVIRQAAVRFYWPIVWRLVGQLQVLFYLMKVCTWVQELKYVFFIHQNQNALMLKSRCLATYGQKRTRRNQSFQKLRTGSDKQCLKFEMLWES